jgi:hypothetical protein
LLDEQVSMSKERGYERWAGHTYISTIRWAAKVLLNMLPWLDQFCGQFDFFLELSYLDDSYTFPMVGMSTIANKAIECVVYVAREDVPTTCVSCL